MLDSILAGAALLVRGGRRSGVAPLDSFPPLFYGALFFIGGVMLGRFDQCAIALLATLFVGLFSLWWFSERPYSLLYLSLAFFGLCVISAADYAADHAPTVPSGKADVIVVVSAIDSVRLRSVRYRVTLEGIDGEVTEISARWYHRHDTGEALFLPGDRIKIDAARLKERRGFRNDGGFDYAAYLKDQGIGGMIFSSSRRNHVTILDRHFHWRRWLERLKNRMRRNLTFPDDESRAAALAILIGDQGKISVSLRESFARSSLSHLLAVSGLHIGFVAASTFFIIRLILFLIFYRWRYPWAARGAPIIIAAGVALVVVVFYGALTGPRTPALRASIMVGVYLVAVMRGEGRNFYGAYAVALLLVLLVRPASLFEAGFQLSFCAVFFIAWFMERYCNNPQYESELDRLTPSFARRMSEKFPVLSGYVGASLFAFIGSAPVAAYHFHLLPLWSVPVNSLVVPLASLVVPLGILSALTGEALELTHLSMRLLCDAAQMIAARPGAAIMIPAFPVATLVFFYALFPVFIVGKKGPMRNAMLLLLAGATVVTLLINPLRAHFDDRLRLRFLDVGQGEAILALLPKGGALLIDAGSRYPGFDLGRSVVVPALLRSGRNRLNALIATHSDQDHGGGLPGVYASVNGGVFYDNGYPVDYAPLALLRERARKEGRYHPLKSGDRLTFDGGVVMDVLHPPPPSTASHPYRENDNNHSLLLRLVYGSTSILLTGDLDRQVERFLMDQGVDLSADVLKVAHHGSQSGTSVAFLKEVNPTVAVISLGYRNRFRHPSRAVVERIEKSGARLYRTDQDGEVIVVSDGKTIVVTCARGVIRRN